MPVVQSVIMAKKKARKKHQFKHVRPAGPAASGVPAGARNSSAPAGTPPPASPARPALASADPAHAYVIGDVRRVVVMATGFVALQVALWYLLNSTELGERLYSLIKL